MGNMLESCGVGRKIDEEGQEENIIPGTPANQTILGCAIPQATPETPISSKKQATQAAYQTPLQQQLFATHNKEKAAEDKYRNTIKKTEKEISI
tara:strand:+ start:26 stop:307 length:282 start_codon:yes stop_codon:yes gene_type:complete